MMGTRPVAGLAPLEYRYGLDAALPVLAADNPSGSQPLVLCNIPELADEVRQRLPHAVAPGPLAAAPGPLAAAPGPLAAAPGPLAAAPGPLAAAPGPLASRTDAADSPAAVHAALWIEPLAATLETDCEALAGSVRAGGWLVVIASQPLARILGERSRWGSPHLWGQGGGLPAGVRIGGMHGLLQTLAGAGFHLEARYDLHSVPAIAANWMSRRLERWGRPDLGDRLHFWARLHYCSGAGGRSGVLGLPVGISTVALLVARKVAG